MFVCMSELYQSFRDYMDNMYYMDNMNFMVYKILAFK